MSEPRRASRRSFGRAAAIVGVAVLLVLFALYQARKVIAREALVGWLRAHGIAAQGEVRGVSLERFSGRLSAGDPKSPDFVVGDAEVTYGLRGTNVEVRSVTLHSPTLRARLRDGRLSFGQLDPLIEELTRKPPDPNAPKPRIEIAGGTLLLATDYGPVRLALDARVQEGRLMSLAARSAPARLKGQAFDLSLGAAVANVRTTGPRVSLTLDAPLESVAAGRVTAGPMRLQVSGEAAYPDLARKRSDGAVVLHARLTGRAIGLGDQRLEAPELQLDFQGRSSGWVDDLSLAGAATADLRAAAAAAGGTRLGPVRATLKSGDLAWTRRGGDVVAATTELTALLRDTSAGDLRLTQLLVRGRGPVRYDRDGVRAAMTASLDGHGSWKGLGPATPADAPQLAAVKTAARGFQIAAPAVAVEFRPGAAQLALPQPLRLRGDRGGSVIVSGRSGAPIAGPAGGAFRLSVHGGGLPDLDADVRRLQVAKGVTTLQGDVRASGSLDPVQQAALDVGGTLRLAAGAASFTADRCANVSAARVVIGADDLKRLSGHLCPSGGPMFASGPGHWRLQARAGDLTADAPFLQARIAGASGSLVAEQVRGALGLTAALTAARVTDEAPDPRFNPLQLAGTARLADGRLTANVRASTPTGKPVVEAALSHDTETGSGGLTLDTGSLAFADGGLQPTQLSPMAQALGSPVVGHARFTGHVDWTARGMTSGGTLSVPDLDFTSPVGRVSGLQGAVAFTSLAPLAAAPGQTLKVARLDAAVPLTGVTGTFGLDDRALTVTSGEASVGGGRLRIESLTVPLVSGAATGVLALDGVQLHDLVEASPFGDRVDLDARVSGRVPFQSEGSRIRISDAELHAIQPGRLSISRQALTGVAASGSVEAPAGPAAPVPANDTFTDFAYQAMENLAFDKLEAAVASREDGRLGIRAHIVGRHDPPQHQEIRLSIFDLIGRKFLTRPLPLPSGTGVDLTLDTTLNLDDLVADYAGYQQLRSSRPVQPAPAKTETKPLETPR